MPTRQDLSGSYTAKKDRSDLRTLKKRKKSERQVGLRDCYLASVL